MPGATRMKLPCPDMHPHMMGLRALQLLSWQATAKSLMA